MTQRATPEALEAAARALEAKLDDIPQVEIGAGRAAFERSRAARKAAIEDIAEAMRDQFGARIRFDAITSRMTMLGVSTTCTAGGEGLFRNWIGAARRVAGALKEEIEQ